MRTYENSIVILRNPNDASSYPISADGLTGSFLPMRVYASLKRNDDCSNGCAPPRPVSQLVLPYRDPSQGPAFGYPRNDNYVEHTNQPLSHDHREYADPSAFDDRFDYGSSSTHITYPSSGGGHGEDDPSLPMIPNDTEASYSR